DLTQEYDNVIVLRSFSKAYGLAALRIGYAVSSASIAEILNYTRQSFNTSTLAHAAATAAIKDQHFINQYLAFNHEQKQA
ncbi:aminotransferase class I/II-fold pyridoxal phosphate-dependent enzyme, partial [Klebsiella pneumoniae]|nr:aminotransferase class I/II-fold pyridoxal phosphate-dependent enzyme [Klebsiella pneumoniae]